MRWPGRGHLRHGREAADVDAEVRNLLVRGSLRLVHEDDAGDEEDEERHSERAHTRGADLSGDSARARREGAVRTAASDAAGAQQGGMPDAAQRRSSCCAGARCRRPQESGVCRKIRPRADAPRRRAESLTSSIVVHGASGATSRMEKAMLQQHTRARQPRTRPPAHALTAPRSTLAPARRPHARQPPPRVADPPHPVRSEWSLFSVSLADKGSRNQNTFCMLARGGSLTPFPR